MTSEQEIRLIAAGAMKTRSYGKHSLPTEEASYADEYKSGLNWKFGHDSPGGPHIYSKGYDSDPDWVAYCEASLENNIAWKKGWKEGREKGLEKQQKQGSSEIKWSLLRKDPVGNKYTYGVVVGEATDEYERSVLVCQDGPAKLWTAQAEQRKRARTLPAIVLTEGCSYNEAVAAGEAWLGKPPPV
jgi:hypothetical protein